VLERSTDNHHPARLPLLVFLPTSFLAAGPVMALTAGASTYRSRVLSMVNRRDRKGLDPVKLNVRLSGDAPHRSRVLVGRDRVIEVKDLAAVLKPFHGSFGGEVVACGSSLFQVHRDLMRDAVHRDISCRPRPGGSASASWSRRERRPAVGERTTG
jgi:hypothetical protein